MMTAVTLIQILLKLLLKRASGCGNEREIFG
jgi:hypothetical protein